MAIPARPTFPTTLLSSNPCGTSEGSHSSERETNSESTEDSAKTSFREDGSMFKCPDSNMVTQANVLGRSNVFEINVAPDGIQ